MAHAPLPAPDDTLSRMLEIHLQHTREKILLLEALQTEFGPGVSEVVARTAQAWAKAQWEGIATKAPGHRPDDLVALLWEPLREKGFVFEVHARPRGVQVICTRCPVVALAQATGGQAWLRHLTCGVDAAIVEGFNPAITFSRTRTLLDGDACCDHGYYERP